jgi:hypothetical protein
MPQVCVGCGLEVVGGKLVLAANPVTAYAAIGSTFPDASGMDTLGLAIIAPNPSTGPANNVGIAKTDLAVIEVTNESDCRPLTFMITASGRTRLDTDGDELDASTANVVANEIRVNGGDWELVDLSAYAQDAGTGARRSRSWNDLRQIEPVTIAPGDTLTIDRRGTFRWETNLIANKAFWNLPSISVFGF